MGWSFLDFTGLSRFFGRLPEKLVTTETTQTISGTKSFSSTILGSVSGSAASAAKDGAGNVITDTYETKADAAAHLSKSDAAGTYLSKTDAASTCVQTGAVDQTVGGTKTFSKPIVGSVTGSSGSCTGNAATATKATQDAAGNTITTTYATKAENNTKANDSEVVHKSGDETISGAKTFTGDIIGINKDSSTEDANSLYSTTAGSKLTYYTTSNGFTTLVNVPATVNTTLESRTIRRLSDSNWIVEQICHNSNGLYYRKGINGTWGAWKTFAFTDSNISGNAATATKATGNANGKELTNTIIKGLSISGKTITYTQIDGNTGTLTTQDTVYTHPTTAGNKHIPSGGSSGQFLGWASDGTAKWVNNPNTNTDTLMTQNVSTTNATYPVLLVATADATANQGAKTGIFAKSVKVNPSTNVISASGFSGPLTGNVTGNCSGSSGSCTGNAASATKLQTARTINGTSFDGTANITTANWGTARNITITDGTNTSTAVSVNGSADVSLTLPATIKATFVGNITGNVTGNCSGSSGSCTGNSATATKLAAAHTIALSGAATGTATAFDGSGNVTIPVTALAASAIRAQWYAAYPDGAEAHNAMWGGRDITASFDDDTVSEHIYDGTFKDIFPGDYITKSVTIPQVLADDGTTVLFAGGTYTINWVVADCDYWINKGDTAIPPHHVVIVPQIPIFYVNMNATNTTEGGYAGSAMYKNIIPACATGIINAFGSDHILTFRDGISNSVDTSHISSGIPQYTGTPGWWGEWVSVQCNLMSEKMVYGAPICSAGAMDNTMATRQMSAFRLSERLINYNRQHWWLRDVVSSALFADVHGVGYASASPAAYSRGVRPFALLV